MAIDREKLKEYAAENGIVLEEGMLSAFEEYGESLKEWNEKVNLTAIVDDEGILVKHFIDSLLLLQAVDLPQGAKVADIGTGAGFPGVPVKIARPDISLVLVDSLNKRLAFLEDLCRRLDISAERVHGRAEDLGRMPQYREAFDLVTARAVTNLRELAEFCLPMVKKGGCFGAMKGFEVEEELAQAKKAIALLGGRVQEVRKYTLPDGGKRSVVVIKKISQTPTKYPRPFAKITKNPLI